MCGTVHCAAGWYAVSQKDTERWEDSVEIGYLLGAEWMAVDLGFLETVYGNPVHYLEDWAADNPEIWGNDDGHDMFGLAWAYGDGHNTRASSLRDIVEHWKRVRRRFAERGKANG